MHLQVEQLDTRDFQATVLAALAELMKEHESLKNTLDMLARAEEQDKLEELERLISHESSSDEGDNQGLNTKSDIYFTSENPKNLKI